MMVVAPRMEDTTMQTCMLIYETGADFVNRTAPHTPAGKVYWDEWSAYSQALGKIVVGGAALKGPETAAL